MQPKEVDCATTGAASSVGVSGRVTADKSNLALRIGKRRAFSRFIRNGLLAGTVAVLPLQQATADESRAFLPTGFLDVSTVASSGDQNPYGVAFVPHGFPSGGPLRPDDILVSNFNDKTRLAAVNDDDNTIIVLGLNTEGFQDR